MNVMRGIMIALLVGVAGCKSPGTYLEERKRIQADEICTEISDQASRKSCVDSFVGALDTYDELDWNVEPATKACQARGLKLRTQKMWRCVLSKAVDLSRM